MKPGIGRQHRFDDFVESGDAMDALRSNVPSQACSSLQDSGLSELTARPFFKRVNGDPHGFDQPDTSKRSKTADLKGCFKQQQVMLKILSNFKSEMM